MLEESARSLRKLEGGLRAMQMAQYFEDISIDDILSVAEREHESAFSFRAGALH